MNWCIIVCSDIANRALLLLFRNHFAVQTYLVSLVAMVITTLQNYVFSTGMESVGDTFSLVFTAVIFLSSVALFVYARAMHKRGVLA